MSFFSDPVRNLTKVTVLTGYDSTATTVVLFPGQGVNLPDPVTEGAFNLVWYNSTDYKDPADDPYVEIVRCTTRTVDTVIIVRAQEETFARNHNIVGKMYSMKMAITAKTVNDLKTVISGYSGYSGSGISGYSGYSGSGISGYSGYSGSGISGFSGYSGSGISGYSGYSGSGISGFSGYSGSGISGYSGYSGYSGIGISGTSGYSGAGYSGASGYSGFSGYSGVNAGSDPIPGSSVVDGETNSSSYSGVELYSGGTQVLLDENTTYGFSLRLIGRRIDVLGDNYDCEVKGTMARGVGLVTAVLSTLLTAIFGSIGLVDSIEDVIVEITANETLGAIGIFITAPPTSTIKWSGSLNLTKVFGEVVS